jgi:uncharacterized protein YjbI with pentapeptide repeats
LTGADLRGVVLQRAHLNAAQLMEVNLSPLRGVGETERDYAADLDHAKLAGANLRGADLRHADLTGADLTGADLSNADLRYADMSDADVAGADLTGAKLEGAIRTRGKGLAPVS